MKPGDREGAAQSPLADPAASRAVLIGSHTYASLGDLPGVKDNLAGLRRLFLDPGVWGLPGGNCTVLEQPRDAVQVIDAVDRAVQEAADTLVVYYAGHGIRDDEDDRLFLGLPASRQGKVHTALPYDWVRRAILDPRAGTGPRCTIVILDCCFSGLAMTGRMGSGDVADSAAIRGTFLMTSVAETQTALDPPDRMYTAFTGELIDMVTEGIPGEPAALDMATVFQHLYRRLSAQGDRRPDQRNRAAGAQIRIFRNRAYDPARDTRAEDLPVREPEPETVPESAPAESPGGWQVDDPTTGWVWRDDAFRWGPFRNPLVILEGDGENVIAEEDVHLIVDRREVELPGEMAEWRREIEKEQQARRERGDDFFWNGRGYAIEKIAISRDAHTEAPAVSIRLRLSDYYSFLAAQQLDRPLADGGTPQTRYIDPYGPLDVPAFMSSSLGTNIAVVTADGQMIFSRRSGTVGSHPGYWNSSANEGLSRDIDSSARGAPNLYNVARRGLREELALEPQEYRLAMLALTVDIKNQRGALFIARLTSLDGDGFTARRSRGVADKFEHVEHRLVPFQTKAMIHFMYAGERRALWAPTPPALYYLALVNEYGRHRVEMESVQAFEELRRSETG